MLACEEDCKEDIAKKGEEIVPTGERIGVES